MMCEASLFDDVALNERYLGIVNDCPVWIDDALPWDFAFHRLCVELKHLDYAPYNVCGTLKIVPGDIIFTFYNFPMFEENRIDAHTFKFTKQWMNL